MVALDKKNKVTLVILALLVVFMLVLAAMASKFKSPPHPGEGSVDPASGIHITVSGDITDSQGTSSSSIIRRDGNIYTLTGNTTSMVTIEKSNVVLDGRGFSAKRNFLI